MGGMLDGITVIDLASVGPAARTSRWLADYGARVIKVGPVPKDGGVQIVPPFFAYSGGRGMQRAAIDLKADQGKAAFLKLVEQADVVIESFRPGVVDRLGIGYSTVSARNPKVVYCSTSGYGQTGPASQWAGHDLNYLAVSGFLDCSGRDEEGKPALPGATVADSAGGGMQAVIAILAALVQRSHTETGSYLDVAIADGVLGIMSLYIDEYLATGVVPGPGHNMLTGKYACYDVYTCADGKHVSVGAIEPQFFRNLCRLLGCEQWASSQLDDAVQDQIRADFQHAFASNTRDAWVAILAPADTCVAPVATVPELVESEQFRARNAFVTAEAAGHGPFPQLGWVFAGQDQEQHPGLLPEPTATHTSSLLEAAGMSSHEIDALVTAGVIA